MGECSTLSPNMPSGSGLGDKRSRHSSDDSDDDLPPVKVTKKDVCTLLLDLPERQTDPGSETEYSFQEESTDLCCRSSDTSSSALSERIEFEIRSPEEGPNIFGDSSTASDASVTDLKWFRQPPPPKSSGKSSPSGASSGDSECFDPEIPRRDYWTCLQCNCVNNRPAFRYCEKCYKVRRDMFQPRAKPRKRRKRKNSNFTARKANSDGTNKFGLSRTFGDNIKSSDGLVSSPAFSGIKLQSCSQDNRDSGVACSQSSGLGCSQSTLGSGHPGSDSSLSPDSGADTRDFHGVRLSSTRVRVVELSPLSLGVVESFGLAMRRDVIGVRPNTSHRDRSRIALTRTLSRGGDKAGSWSPVQNRAVSDVPPSPIRGIDEVDSVPQPTTRDVDVVQPSTCRGMDDVVVMRPPSSRGTDDIRALCPPSSQGTDDVDAVWPPESRGIDDVDTVRPSTSRGVSDIDTWRLPVSRGTDDVDAGWPPTSRGVDDVDTGWPPVNQGVDDIDAGRPPGSQGVDDVDAGRPPTSRGVDDVDAGWPPVNQGVDDIDAGRPPVSQGVDDVDAGRPPTSRGVDDVDAGRPSSSQGVDDVDAGRPSSSQGVDDVDAGQPSSGRGVDDVDTMQPPSSWGVDNVDAGRSPASWGVDDVDGGRPAHRCVNNVDAGRPPTSRRVDDDDAVRPPRSCNMGEVDAVPSSLSQGIRVHKVDVLPSPASLDVNNVSPSKCSVQTQTELCFISQSGIPKDKVPVEVNKCMMCDTRSLDGIFVHATMAHMCCCYKCSVRILKTTKRCPLCNCKVMNVLRLFKGC